jgi:serine protease Do
MAQTNWLRQYGAGLAVGAALMAAVAQWGPNQQAVAVPSVRDAQQLSQVFRSVSAEALPSIVSIETTTKARPVDMQSPLDDENSPFREFFRDDPRFREFFRQPRRGMVPRRQGAGSGFIIDASGVIMTNNHVVSGADVVRVKLYDGREFVAKEIKADPRTDVAILRIEGAGPLHALKLGDSRAMEVGDWVLAFGSPFGLETTVTQGIISGKSRSRGGQIADREDFLQTDAAINPGNSGGPLVNLNGEVIGINTAIASASGGYDGIGFAVPTHIAGWVGDQLVKNGSVKRGYLGTAIASVDANTAQQFKVAVREGAIIREVRPNSPADKAGVEPGDVILLLNGEKVSDPPSLQGIVERLEIGTAYPLEVLRDGKKQTLKVTIEEMPTEYTAQRGESSAPDRTDKSFDSLGLEVRPLTKELSKQLGLTNATGVVVTGVKEDGPTALAGIKQGDIIERVGSTPVTTVEEFQKAVAGLSLKEGIVLHLRNADGRRYVIVQEGDAQ